MPRPSKIWFRTSHKCHYIKLGGKLVRLDPDYSRSVALLESLGRPVPAIPPAPHGPTVAVLAERYLDAVRHRVRPTTLVTLGWAVRAFAAALGAMRADEVRPRHVQEWLASRGWGKASWATYGGHVRMMFRWACDEEILPAYHLHRLRLPAMPRREPVTEAQARAFRAAIRRADLADWFDLAVACGARPGELARLEARHVAQDRLSGVVAGKAGKRAIWFPAALCGRIDALCERIPSGPLLRGYRGQPWQIEELGQRFRVISSRCGVKLVPYHTRSLFASRCYAAGCDHETVQVLLGHRPKSVLARHYLTVPESRLLEAVDRGWEWARANK